MSQIAIETRDTQSSQSSVHHTKAKAKEKRKVVASAPPLKRIKSGNKTPSQSYSTTHSIQRLGSDVDNSASTNDGNDAKGDVDSSASTDDGNNVRESWSRLHNLRIVHGPESSILRTPPMIQIMELDKVLVKFMHERKRESKWMIFSKCDRTYTT